jgi:hypothetical protein
VRERSNRVRFALESRERIRVCCDGGWNDLDRDVAIQSGIPSAIHLADATSSERRQDCVRRQRSSLASDIGADS